MWRACHVSQCTQLSVDTDLYGLADLHTAITPGLFHSLERHRRLQEAVLGWDVDNVSLSMTTVLWGIRRGEIRAPSANAYKYVQTQARPGTLRSIRRCAVTGLTPAVVVSWFKGSVITNGDELACECQQAQSLGVGMWGQSWGWPLEGGKPDLPQRPAPFRTACTAPPRQNQNAAPPAVAIETSPKEV